MTMLRIPLLAIGLALTSGAISAQPATSPATAFVGARIIDGRGQVIERGTIIVRDGKIAAVGTVAATAVPANAQRVDVTGRTIMPGMVNAHGHLTNVVGMRADPKGASRENLVRQLKTYAMYGVTTVFSLGEDGEVAEAALSLRNEQAAGTLDRARLFVAGPVITGNDAASARAMTDKVAAMKPDLLKIRIDDNLGSARKMPEEAWRATAARANELKLPLSTHIFYLSDAKAALLAGASVIAHSVRDVAVDPEFVRELRSRRACYSPTLMREVSTYVYGSTPPWASDPFFVKSAGAEAAREISDPASQAKEQASNGYKQGLRYKVGLEVAKKNLKTISDAGVTIGMGTDTGPARRWQGFFEHLELELMVEAGMTPMQVIVAATSNAAACHGRAGEFGSIQPGLSADLLVLSANPLDTIRNTRTIQSVWVQGKRLE